MAGLHELQMESARLHACHQPDFTGELHSPLVRTGAGAAEGMRSSVPFGSIGSESKLLDDSKLQEALFMRLP